MSHVPADFSDSLYVYIPNHDATLAAFICFSLVCLFNIAVSLWYKQWWFGISFLIATLLEIFGYIGRFLSSTNPTNTNYYIMQTVCITVAPAFIMGGVYFLLAKFAMIYGPNVSRLRPMWYSYIFVSRDAFSIFLQGAGGAIASTAVQRGKSAANGTHIMVAGLAFQVVSITLFLLFCGDFYIRVVKAKRQGFTFNPAYEHIRSSKVLVPFLSAGIICTVLIYIRCIYRTVELAEGWRGYLMLHEVYFLIFEALIVFLAVLSLTVIHPGFLFTRTKVPIRGPKKSTCG